MIRGTRSARFYRRSIGCRGATGVQSSRAQPDEEARENVIDALRELLVARFGSPPELSDRPDSDSLELTIAA